MPPRSSTTLYLKAMNVSKKYYPGKILNDFMNIVLTLCFFLVPIIIWKPHFHLFEAMKEFIFISSVLISAGIAAVACIINGRIGIRKTRLTYAVLLYYLYNLCSFLLFPYTDTAYFFSFSCLILLFFVVSSATTAQYRDKILYGLMLATLISTIYGYFQFLGVDFDYLVRHTFPHRTIAGGSRIFTTFGQPNLLGGFYVFMLPVIGAFLVKSVRCKTRLRTVAFGMLFVGSVLALFMNETRGSWFAFLCSCCIFVVFVGRKSLFSFVMKYQRVSSIGICILVIGAVSISSFLIRNTSLTDGKTLNIRVFIIRPP